jgi:uncharacterized protein (TIGR02453 family)
MMVTNPDMKQILVFLDGLSQNNQKTWFEGHRADYQTARTTFEQFIDSLIDEFRAPDHLEGLSARDCMPRIYRDIRFSKDKSPYKTNLGALIGPGGWRGARLGYYVSVEPHGHSMVAGGLYDPMPEQLEQFRRTIARDARAFKRVTQHKGFVTAFGEVQGDRLKTAPKGYDRAHPEIALLQLKQITAYHSFSDEAVLANDFREQVIYACRVLRPFLDVLNDIVL